MAPSDFLQPAAPCQHSEFADCARAMLLCHVNDILQAAKPVSEITTRVGPEHGSSQLGRLLPLVHARSKSGFDGDTNTVLPACEEHTHLCGETPATPAFGCRVCSAAVLVCSCIRGVSAFAAVQACKPANSRIHVIQHHPRLQALSRPERVCMTMEAKSKW